MGLVSSLLCLSRIHDRWVFNLVVRCVSGLVKLYYSARRSQNEDHVHDNDDDRDDDDVHDDNDDDDNDGDKRWPRPNYQASLPPIGSVLFLREGEGK